MPETFQPGNSMMQLRAGVEEVHMPLVTKEPLGVASWHANTRESHHPASKVSRQPGVWNTRVRLVSCQTGLLDGFFALLPGTSMCLTLRPCHFSVGMPIGERSFRDSTAQQCWSLSCNSGAKPIIVSWACMLLWL